MISNNSPPMIHTVTGIRAVAAIWIVLLHMSNGAPDGYLPGLDSKIIWGWLEPIIMRGIFAVDIFFIISGFILSYVYASKFSEGYSYKKIKRFYILRLARIYPLHLFFTLFFVVLYYLNIWDAVEVNSSKVLINLTLTNTLGQFSINKPSWSISAEMFAYLLFPFLSLFIYRLNNRAMIILCIFFLPIVYFTILLSSMAVIQPYDWSVRYVHYFSLMRVNVGLVVGCLLYQLYLNPIIRKEWLMEVGFVASTITFIIIHLQEGGYDLQYLFAPIFLYFAFTSPKLAKYIFANKVMIYLGTISYSVYLAHIPVMEIIRLCFNDTFSNLDKVADQGIIRLYFILIVGAIILVASASYHLIEAPCRNWIKHRVIK